MKESSPPHGFDGLEPPPSSGNSFHMVYSGNFLASMGYLILSRPPLVTVRGTILLNCGFCHQLSSVTSYDCKDILGASP